MVSEVILNKLRKYCAYQERCHEEVRSKLLSLHVHGALLDEAISKLIQEDFLNEERFASAYAGGKFRMKHWGRIRIRHALEKRKISSYCIQKALGEISEEDYLRALHALINTARKQYREEDPRIVRSKIIRFLLRKGYERDLIYAQIS